MARHRLAFGLAVTVVHLARVACGGDAPPAERPAAIRQQAVAELRQFRKEATADFRDVHDEHVGRWIGRNFAESQARALLALVWAGDDAACREAEALLPPTKEKEQGLSAYLRELFAHEKDFFHKDTWPAWRERLAQALDGARPELARKIRVEFVQAEVAKDPHVTYSSPKGIEDMPLDELARRIQQPGLSPPRDAMRRWLILSPGTAEPWLVALMNDQKADPNQRTAAAGALAMRIFDDEPRLKAREPALEWLKAACFRNLGLGGQPARYLAEANTSAFLKLLGEHDGKDLPYPFAYAIEDCREDLFLSCLETFLALKNSSAAGKATLRLGITPLPRLVLAKILDHIEAGRFERWALVRAVASSAARFPPRDEISQRLLATWVDHMQEEPTGDLWQEIGALHLATRLGTPEAVARGARLRLGDQALTALACDLLGEVGKTEDVPLIWRAIHAEPKGEKAVLAWKARLPQSKGWLAICRLTSHLAPP